ncbi:MAG TPA: hypothetical protein VEO01_39460, partial [Pseudonocardiaceae bacterium]|nr:hypothetical protein [Pseudonocardiaceae bacterium]
MPRRANAGIEPDDHTDAGINRPDPASGLMTEATIMEHMPAAINQATRSAVTARITTHVKRGWPRLRPPQVRFRGQFCYVDAVLPGHRKPTPILRLRYQGSPDRWDIGIYL